MPIRRQTRSVLVCGSSPRLFHLYVHSSLGRRRRDVQPHDGTMPRFTWRDHAAGFSGASVGPDAPTGGARRLAWCTAVARPARPARLGAGIVKPRLPPRAHRQRRVRGPARRCNNCVAGRRRRRQRRPARPQAPDQRPAIIDGAASGAIPLSHHVDNPCITQHRPQAAQPATCCILVTRGTRVTSTMMLHLQPVSLSSGHAAHAFVRENHHFTRARFEQTVSDLRSQGMTGSLGLSRFANMRTRALSDDDGRHTRPASAGVQTFSHARRSQLSLQIIVCYVTTQDTSMQFIHCEQWCRRSHGPPHSGHLCGRPVCSPHHLQQLQSCRPASPCLLQVSSSCTRHVSPALVEAALIHHAPPALPTKHCTSIAHVQYLHDVALQIKCFRHQRPGPCPARTPSCCLAPARQHWHQRFHRH